MPPPQLPAVVTKAASYCVPSALIGPPHAHPDEWQVMYVIAGMGNVRIGDHWYAVRARDLYMIKPGQMHASDDDDRAEPELWEIRFSVADDAAPFALSSIADIARDVRDPALLETMRELIDEYSGQQEGSECLCALLAQELLVRASRLRPGDGEGVPAGPPGRHAEAMAQARRLIHFRFHEPLTVALLAREVSMSPRRFSEVFRQSCGKSPMDYVIDVRLDRAAELLKEGRLTVSQIADRTGFASVHYFSRLFHRRRGVTPTDYMSLAQAGESTRSAGAGSSG